MLLLLSRHDVAMPPRHTPLASKQLRDHAWTTDKVLYDTSTLKPTEAAVELQWFEESTGVWISADRTKKRNILTFPWGVFDQVERLSLKPRWVYVIDLPPTGRLSRFCIRWQTSFLTLHSTTT
jgi:hypothetical protein